MLTTVSLAALSIAFAATICDLATRRIPNVLTFGAAGAGLVFHLSTSGASGGALALLGWLVGALVFIVPFALRGLGGGDVKLMAALGAWLGAGSILWLALYTGVAGGVLAIVVAIAHGYLRRALSNVWLMLRHWRVSGMRAVPDLTLQESKAPKLAYALPIFVGTVAVIWLR